MKTKQLRRVYSNTALELRQIVREIEVLRGMKHDSIVEMREYFISAPAGGSPSPIGPAGPPRNLVSLCGAL